MSIISAASLAYRDRLLTDPALYTLLGGASLSELPIFSRRLKPGFSFPTAQHKYITIGDKTETEVGVMGDGSSMTLTSHAWTRGFYDDAPVEQLAAVMDAAVKGAPLTVVGYGGVVLRLELLAVIDDPDIEVRHAYLRHRITTLRN